MSFLTVPDDLGVARQEIEGRLVGPGIAEESRNRMELAHPSCSNATQFFRLQSQEAKPTEPTGAAIKAI